jgi:glycine/D-amino acid oxidase-like deaminating enzyme/nitrite reductase/ring-hydroxylating ferredoxin subunit
MHRQPSSALTETLWLREQRPLFSALAGGAQVELCVIGAGIAGLTTAYLAAAAGRKVIVLDAGELISGESGRTTAHISNAFDDRYCEMEKLHGADATKLIAQSHTQAIDLIEQLIQREHIDCEFERIDGYLLLGPSAATDLLERERDAAQRAGLIDVRLLASAPDFSGGGPCLLFPRQAQFHPVKYLNGLTRALLRLGGVIYTQTKVTAVTDGAPVKIETESGYTVVAQSAVVATNTPINDRVAIHTKQAAYRSYVVGLEIPAGVLPHRLYWDTEDPYHYVRLAAQDNAANELLIVGGEDHKTGQDDDQAARWQALEQWARQHFPQVQTTALRWSGQIIEPADGVAYIGRNPGDKHVYIATGDSGNGMTHGTLAGILLNDLLAGRDNPWADLYSPQRKPPLGALTEYGRENLNVVAQYREWATPGDIESIENIPRGRGALLRAGLHKIAAFRDDDGKLHLHQATCPHLGCIVQWNAAESSWDCPCHGSRFDGCGRVLNGPAISNLSAATLPARR